MEKLKTIIGALITSVVVIAVLFKMMHWPGAGILLVLSASSLAMYVVIAAGIMKFKVMTLEDQLSIFGSKTKLAGMSASVLIVGLLFKIMHWPGAGPMMIVGLGSFAIISILFLISFLRKKEPIVLTSTLFYSAFSMCILFLGFSSSGDSSLTILKMAETAISIENNINIIDEANTKITSKTKDINGSHIYEATEEINHYINDIKSLLYQNTDYLPEEIADTISFSQIMGKDNYDVPTLILGLADPSNPRNEEYSATQLKHKIESFNDLINEVSPNTKTINTEDYAYYNGQLESWETSMFYHYTLSQVILTLNQIQLEANIICNTILTDNLLKETNTQQPDSIN